MSFYTPFGVVTESKSNTLRYITGGVLLQHTKASTDKIFLTNLKLVSLLTSFAYSVEDKDSLAVGNGDFTSSPIYINDISAFTTTDAISARYLKYGYQYKKASFVLTPVETLLFMAQDVNSFITEPDNVIVAAYTGIAFDKANKKITVSSVTTKQQLYDYIQYQQSLTTNYDLLIDGEILSTNVSGDYTLLSIWSLVFTVAPSGDLSIIGDVTLNAQFDITDLDVTGTLFFDVSSTLTATNSQIANVDIVTGDEVVSYTPSSDSNTPTNLNATQITIVAPQPNITIVCKDINTNDIIVGVSVILYSSDNLVLPIKTTLITDVSDVNGEVKIVNYAYTADQNFSGRARKGTTGTVYKTSKFSGIITNNDLNLTVLMIRD